MATVVFEEQLEIPSIADLTDFRAWALSDDFPERGRIDYVAGRIEVDMSPEDLFTHGTLKLQVAGKIEHRVADLDLGHVFVGETRISSPEGNFSAEPDVVVISHEALDEGRVTLIPKSTGEQGRFVEIEGGVDLIVEIVSDSSVTKDTKRLPAAYFQAGVRENWLIDARGERLVFHGERRGTHSFEPALVDENGFQRSDVLDCLVRLDRERHRRGHWAYRLLLQSQKVGSG
jgi:Uma2 family endonuclease